MRIAVSSAKRDRQILLFLGMSFMNRLNSKGPRIDPWGTPAFIGLEVEVISSTLTLKERLDR